MGRDDKIIRIILMNYQNNQEDECFVAMEAQEHSASDEADERIAFNDEIRNSLPQANQLKAFYRPTNMVARVMNTQPDIYALPTVVNQPCEEIALETASSNARPKLNNKQKLGLAEYLSRKQFWPVYIKNPASAAVRNNISEMTIRLRTISQVSDYDGKQFKQISQQQENSAKVIKSQIDSNFQCGNLARAYCNINHQNSYYLLLEQDTNTHGYTNWFFYRVRNLQKCCKRFFILNMVKRTSFYKQEMKISVFSMKKYKQQGIKWHKTGSNVSFFQTNFLRQQHNEYFNCLYFEYDFDYTEDQVFFAVTQPYTYTRMANFIQQVDEIQRGISLGWKVQTIGYSVSNNIIPSITFFAKNQSLENKKTIVIMGRQHPSEMAGSFISESLIKLFTSSSQQVSLLVRKFNILIIPMVNVDGVIYGNSRSNLTGLDLNRHWGFDAIKELTPETHKIRSLFCQLQKNNSHIKFLLDLHGHGKKLNSFLFCCKKQDRISNRHFPLIMSKLEQRFDLISCTYGISRDKEKTIRAQLFDIGINDCYTLENSYYGYQKKKGFGINVYKESDYLHMAQSIIKSLYVYFGNEKDQKEEVKQKIGWNLDSINEQLIKIVDKLQREEKNFVNDEDIMSESDPEGDGLKLQQRLKLCTDSKVLDKKIRQSYKKNKSVDKSVKNSKKLRPGQKNQKFKTQPLQQEKQDQQEDIRVLQKKIEGKLILSKKLRTHNKIKTSIRERRSMLETKRPQEQAESKLVKKMLNKPFNPFKIPSQQPSSRLSSSLYSQVNSASKTKNFQRCKMYQKLKTEITQNHSFSVLEIQRQHQRKQKMEQQLSKLKEQNLKNVVKQSLLFMGSSLKSKKCKWIEDKRPKNMSSNHLIQARLNSFSFNIDQFQNIALKPQKSETNIDKQKIIIRPSSQFLDIKTKSQQKRTKPKRSYHRFQSFVKNSPSFIRQMHDSKGPVFYHFPVM